MPEPYWLLVSLLGVEKTHLGNSNAFFYMGDGTAIEDRIFANPIEIRREDASKDEVYLKIADAIWHGYGKLACPPEYLKKLFAQR